MVSIETTRCVCDHCNELGPGVIISAVFADQVNDSIQLCIEHAKWIGEELQKD